MASQQRPTTATNAGEVLMLFLELAYADVSLGDETCRGLAEGLLASFGDSLLWPAMRYLTRERETFALLQHNASLRRIQRRQRREAILAEKERKAQDRSSEGVVVNPNSTSPNFRASENLSDKGKSPSKKADSAHALSESRPFSHNLSTKGPLLLPLTTTPYPTIPQLHVCELLARLRSLLTTSLSLYGTRAMILEAPDVLSHFPLALAGIREVVVGAHGSVREEQPVIVERILKVLAAIEGEANEKDTHNSIPDGPSAVDIDIEQGAPALQIGLPSPTATYRLLKSLLGDLIEALLSTAIELAAYANAMPHKPQGIRLLDADPATVTKVLSNGGVRRDGPLVSDEDARAPRGMDVLLEAVLGAGSTSTEADDNATYESAPPVAISPPTLSQPNFTAANIAPEGGASTPPPLTPITEEILAEKAAALPSPAQVAVAAILEQLSELKAHDYSSSGRAVPAAAIIGSQSSAILTLADGTQGLAGATQLQMASSVLCTPQINLTPEAAGPIIDQIKSYIVTNPRSLVSSLWKLVGELRGFGTVEGEDPSAATDEGMSDAITTFIADAHSRSIRGKCVEADGRQRKKRRVEKQEGAAGVVAIKTPSPQISIGQGFYSSFAFVADNTVSSAMHNSASAEEPSLRSLSELLAARPTRLLVAAVADIGSVKTAEAGGLSLGTRFESFAKAKRRWWADFSGEGFEGAGHEEGDHDSAVEGVSVTAETTRAPAPSITHMLPTAPVVTNMLPLGQDPAPGNPEQKAAKEQGISIDYSKVTKKGKSASVAKGAIMASAAPAEESPFSVAALFSQPQKHSSSSLALKLRHVDALHKRARDEEEAAQPWPIDITDQTPSRMPVGGAARALLHSQAEIDAAHEDIAVAELMMTCVPRKVESVKFVLSEDGRRYIAVPV